MKRIPLTNSKLFALVDDCDYKLISQYRWSLYRPHNVNYAVAYVMEGGKRKALRMHRVILGSEHAIIDHINGNGLDNSRGNLRAATSSQNQANMRSRTKSSSKYKGVSRKNGKWVAQIQYEKKKIHLGYYQSECEAAVAYNIAARKYFGEYACLNNVDESITPKRVRHNVSGNRNGSAKLTYHQVAIIRDSELSSRTLSTHYGVCVSTINRIRSGKLWKQEKERVWQTI